MVGVVLPLAALFLVLAVARRPALPPGVAPALPRLEAEVEAAKGTGLYLVLDPTGRALAIRARGRTLDTVPLEGVRVELHRPPGELAPAGELGLWTVAVEPEGTYRRVIAPPALRPYEEEEEGVESGVPGPSQPPEVLPDPPASFLVGLDPGWELAVVQELAPDTAWSRFRQALAEGWARLWGRAVLRPSRLVLLATPEQGSRLHHLFRQGTPIVLAHAPLPPTAPGAAPIPETATPAPPRDPGVPPGS